MAESVNKKRVELSNNTNKRLVKSSQWDLYGKWITTVCSNNNQWQYRRILCWLDNIKPTKYTLRHDNQPGAYLRYWNFEGSNNGNDWIIIKKHKNDQ